MKKEQRKVFKDLSVQYHNRIIQLKSQEPRRLFGKAVTIYELSDGHLVIDYQGKELEHRLFQEPRGARTVMSSKEMTAFLDQQNSTRAIHGGR